LGWFAPELENSFDITIETQVSDAAGIAMKGKRTISLTLHPAA
jgi:hypothetical protein